MDKSKLCVLFWWWQAVQAVVWNGCVTSCGSWLLQGHPEGVNDFNSGEPSGLVNARTQKGCQWECIAQPCGQQTLAPVASEDGWWGSGWVDGTPFAASRASPIDGDACQCTRSSLVILTNTHGYLYLLLIACTYFWSLAATCSYLRLIVCFQCLFQVFVG